MKFTRIYCTYLFLLCLLGSCQQDNTISNNKENVPLFEILTDSLTHISFNNNLKENVVMNGFNYEYLYNGAGVSVGDVNGDGLPDLYFAANLTDNELYLNKGELTFENVTQKAGVGGGYGLHQGTTMVDINSDGKLDIYVCKSGAFDDPNKRRNELYINQGNDEKGVPVFIEKGKKYGLDLPHYSTQAAFFDYDRDGDLDLFLLNHNTDVDGVQKNMETLRYQKSDLSSDRLFRNDDDYFTDVSDQAGIINDGIGFGLGIAIGDLNNDGWADMVIGQDYTAKDRLYLNQQDGTFQEIMNEATGHISTFSMGNDIADFNNDGWMDFISVDMVSEDNYGIKASMSGMNPDQFNFLVDEGFHYQYMYNTLQLNNGVYKEKNIPVFSDIASMTGISSTDWSWGPLFFDMDNDGDKDLFISNGIKRDFRNVDYIRYRKKKEAELQERLATAPDNLKAMARQQFVADMLSRMPTRKKPNYFYENQGDLAFAKKNQLWTIDKLTASNGAAYADLDNDGDLDIITNNMDEKAFIYRNNSRELGLGNFIKVQLKGSEKNKDGIGARVSITTSQGKQISEQYMTRGFQSSIDRTLHFGLGKEQKVMELKVVWTDGKSQTLQPSAINQTLVVNYSDATNGDQPQANESPIFATITEQTKLKHFAKENQYDDFKKESLLPHKLSEEGPTLAVGDINQDGLDDFYIGGAKGQSGKLYVQNISGSFKAISSTIFQNDKAYEDVNATFFDADQDGDLDLYVVSGSNEYEVGSKFYADRIYQNENGQFKKAANPFETKIAHSGSVVRPYDIDADGDLDLFVGGRQTPGQYPHSGTSLLLRNDSEKNNIRFSIIETPALENLGMVTDALWADLNGDKKAELVVVGEWMPLTVLEISSDGLLQHSKFNIQHSTGWWFSVAAADFDKDGDIDLVAGNLGQNSKYQASENEPFQIHTKDFDQTGSLDIVLSYKQEGKEYPLRGRECSSNQMPFIKKKFPNYHTFASASLEEVYGEENLASALNYQANNFATSYFENRGDGTFQITSLPELAQITTVQKIIPKDINADGHLDLLLFGNMYGFEVETPRQDGGYGLALLGKGDGNFTPLMPYESGLFVKGDAADAATITRPNGQTSLLIAKVNDYLQLVTTTSQSLQ